MPIATCMDCGRALCKLKNKEKKGARVEFLDTRSLRSACVQTSQIEFFNKLPEGALRWSAPSGVGMRDMEK